MVTERTSQARDEAERYQRAAEEALHQLDWCVNYLHRIHKRRLARAVERNVTFIRRQMRQER